MNKTKKPKVLTCINLDFGHNESWAILDGSKVLDQGNRYDHGPLNKSVVDTLAKKMKAKVKWVHEVKDIPKNQQQALKSVDSDWEENFS